MATVIHTYKPAPTKYGPGTHRGGCTCGWISENEYAGPTGAEFSFRGHVAEVEAA